MKIWIINHNAIPPKYGALVRHYYFGRHLYHQGDKVTIFTSSKIHNKNINLCKRGEDFVEEIIDGIQYVYLRSRNYSGNGLDRIINMLQFAWKAGKVDRTFSKPDLIYASSPDIFAAITAQRMAKRLHTPFVLEVRDLWPESIVGVKKLSPNNPIIRFLYKMEKKLYIKANKIIFTMPGGAKYICDKGWQKEVDLQKVLSINNGVDLAEFNENAEKFRMEDEDLLSDQFKVVYCGTIRKANDLGKLLDAAKVIKEKTDAPILFLIYGDGSERSKLEERSRKEGLPIRFKGNVDKKYIPYILKHADLNILNYIDIDVIEKYGSSSNKLFEYIASGKPILSNRLLMNDLICENQLGNARNFESPEEYANEILTYFHLDPKRKEEIRFASDKVIQSYDYKNLSKKVYEVLHDEDNQKDNK